MNIKHKNVLIFGIGKSGVSALKLAQKYASTIFIYDDNKSVLKKYARNSVKVLQEEDISCLDLVVLSPGVNKNNPMLVKCIKEGIQIVSELEFGYSFLKTKNVIAVTGTNGKTTTCELISEVIGTEHKTYKCGNIGIPICDCVEKINKDDYCVIEVSSFMLEDIKTFKPKIALILNLAGDHLDRYNSVEEYQQTKVKITQYQEHDDYLILNYDLANKGIETKANKAFFSSNQNVIGCYKNQDKVYFKKSEEYVEEFVMQLDKVQLKGEHNIQNILASICCAKLCGINNQNITNCVNSFNCIEHRFERITNINGVEYVNDSKATNIHATLSAVNEVKAKVHLLLGGSDKGENFDELFEKLPKNVFVYLFGSTTNKMVHSCLNVGFKNFKICNNMKHALLMAYKSAKQKEIVLLSPACASFDSFTNYEQRGKMFKEWVFELYAKND